jgi:putative ABC transport system permease protein
MIPVLRVLILLAMTVAAAVTASRRARGINDALLLSFYSIAAGAGVAIAGMFATGALNADIATLVPVGSMIIANAIGVVLAAGLLMFDGALAGGLIGALAKWGFGEEHAAYVAERLKAGRYLVVVHTGDAAEAKPVLMNTGAQDVRVADQPA